MLTLNIIKKNNTYVRQLQPLASCCAVTTEDIISSDYKSKSTQRGRDYRVSRSPSDRTAKHRCSQLRSCHAEQGAQSVSLPEPQNCPREYSH